MFNGVYYYLYNIILKNYHTNNPLKTTLVIFRGLPFVSCGAYETRTRHLLTASQTL